MMKTFLIGAVTIALAAAIPASAQLLGGGIGGGIGGGLGGGMGGLNGLGATTTGTLNGAARVDDVAAQARAQARLDRKLAARERKASGPGVVDAAATIDTRSVMASPAASADAALAAQAPVVHTRGVVAATRSGLRQAAMTASGVAVFVPATAAAIAAPVAVPNVAIRDYPAFSSSVAYGPDVVFVDRGEVGGYVERQYGDLSRDLRGTGATVIRRGDNLVVQLPADVTFAFDKSDIRPQFYGALSAFAHSLQAYPASDVEVVGHTDSIGSDVYNLGLSERRGRSVADFLVARRTNPGRLVVEAMGKSEPVESNATVAGRAANRRVEFVIHPRVS